MTASGKTSLLDSSDGATELPPKGPTRTRLSPRVSGVEMAGARSHIVKAEAKLRRRPMRWKPRWGIAGKILASILVLLAVGQSVIGANRWSMSYSAVQTTTDVVRRRLTSRKRAIQ